MKLITFLLTVCCLQVVAYTSAQVTYKATNKPLHVIFTEVGKITGYNFFYRVEDLAGIRNVSVDAKDLSLEAFVRVCIAGQGLDFYVDGKTVVIEKKKIETPKSISVLGKDPIEVTVRVVNEEGEPVAGVTVQEKGTRNAVATNGDGVAKIKVDIDDILVLTAVNIISVEAAVEGRKDFSVKVKGKTGKLDEVQVVAYGTSNQRNNTGSVNSINSDDLSKQPINNPLLGLSGQVPGLTVSQFSGIPGSSVNLQLRGINSIGQKTTPLFIIDGVPYGSPLRSPFDFAGMSSSIFGDGGDISPFNFVNTADISSISILKDADATAIYGSRGANGVILITTKKGKSGAMKLDLNIQSGFGSITRLPKLMSTQQYLEMRKSAFKNDNVNPGTTDLDLKKWDTSSYTDWQNVMVGNKSKYNDVQISMSGGNANSTYLISGGYHKETTVFPGDYNDKKASLHFNVSGNSTNKKFKVSLTGSYMNDNNFLPSTDYTVYSLIAPNAPSLLLPNGSPDFVNFINNVFAARLQTYKFISNNLISNLGLTYEFYSGFEARVSFGYSNSQINEQITIPRSSIRPSIPAFASANFGSTNTSSWIIEPQISYLRIIGDGRINLLFGSTLQNRMGNGQRIEGTNYSSDALLNSLSAAGNISKGPSLYEEYKYNSVFARIGYALKERYLINLTGRRDGSSRFGPGKRFGNFGSIGVGWIFSEESFIKNKLPALTYGKIRASYGNSGNEPLENYKYLELYDFSSGSGVLNTYQGGAVIVPGNLPSSKYSWEVNKKLEAALEIGLFKERLLLTISYYRNRCSNQLLSYNLPYTTGFSGIFTNIPATIQNKGYEISLNTINIRSSNFSWNSSFNISFNIDKLIQFENLESSGYASSYRIGERFTDIRVWQFAGVNPINGIYQFYDKNGKIVTSPDISDQNIYLNTNPKFFGGLQNTLKYKLFELSFLCQFIKQIGRNLEFQTSIPGAFNASYRGNQPADFYNNWKATGDISTYQRFSRSGTALTAYNIARQSDKAYSDASYIRLKNLSISYSFPSSYIKPIFLSNAKLFIHGQNLLTLTKLKGIDPETQNLVTLPPLKVWTLGIQANF